MDEREVVHQFNRDGSGNRRVGVGAGGFGGDKHQSRTDCLAAVVVHWTAAFIRPAEVVGHDGPHVGIEAVSHLAQRRCDEFVCESQNGKRATGHTVAVGLRWQSVLSVGTAHCVNLAFAHGTAHGQVAQQYAKMCTMCNGGGTIGDRWSDY